MANQLSKLLDEWYPQRDATDWVLGTVYRTEGPCYRKAGAMMLFSGLGQQFGMLSGGCLESDIQQHARRVMQSGQAVTLCYDGSDEDDLSFQLGIGCGGTVYILLQPITAEHHYLHLIELRQLLIERKYGYYYQQIPDEGEVACDLIGAASDASRPVLTKSQVVVEGGLQWLLTPVIPDPHLLVVGGGLDARPLVSMAHQQGWQVSLWDPRPANARREFFMEADNILDCEVEQLNQYCLDHKVNGAVLMAHNIGMDAAALQSLQGVELEYLAMLGPLNRQKRVLQQAGLESEKLTVPVAGPAGLDLGAELPEGIALSILAEFHAALKGRKGGSLSGVIG